MLTRAVSWCEQFFGVVGAVAEAVAVAEFDAAVGVEARANSFVEEEGAFGLEVELVERDLTGCAW